MSITRIIVLSCALMFTTAMRIELRSSTAAYVCLHSAKFVEYDGTGNRHSDIPSTSTHDSPAGVELDWWRSCRPKKF
jgi:hypothetical protein